ncbi:MAG: 23S rRNA (uracil(1939)-C(5))-methyltransferase RlmD, partial [Deltaproteobacteria bacterium]|nr:23S rRNA (uracil(1939)-C(5))-methyltransferase RlmD [Deltaproteobacteria bacterium]
MPKRPEPDIRTVTVEGLAYGGAGVARSGGLVLFVPYGLPGDEVEVEVVEKKRDYGTVRITELLNPSTHRRAPPCPAFGTCGGCQWLHLTYEEQLRAKAQILQETLARLGGLHDAPIAPLIPSPHELHYRSRVRLQVRATARGYQMGYYMAGSHTLVPLEGCPLADEAVNDLWARLRQFLNDEERHAIGEIELAYSPDERRAVALILPGGGGHPIHRPLLQHCLERVPVLKGVIGGQRGGGWLTEGDPTLTYVVEVPGATFRCRAQAVSFFQVNLHLNPRLAESVLAAAGLQGGERVLDLYCGVGNLSLPLAARAGSLLGVDLSREAIQDAQANAREHSLTACEFWRAEAGPALAQLQGEGDRFDVVVLDPPREGARGLMEPLARLDPARIVYVSCNPTTLARDLKALVKAGYRVTGVQGLDFFPQTFHLECVAALERAPALSRVLAPAPSDVAAPPQPAPEGPAAGPSAAPPETPPEAPATPSPETSSDTLARATPEGPAAAPSGEPP